MAKIRLNTASARPKGQQSSGTATVEPPKMSNQDEWDELFGGSDDEPATDPLAEEQAADDANVVATTATADPLSGIDSMDVTAFFGGDLPAPGEVSSAATAEAEAKETTDTAQHDPYDFSDLELPDGATDATEELVEDESDSTESVASMDMPVETEPPVLVTCRNCGTRQVDLGTDYVCSVCRVGRLPSYDYPVGHPFHPDTPVAASEAPVAEGPNTDVPAANTDVAAEAEEDEEIATIPFNAEVAQEMPTETASAEPAQADAASSGQSPAAEGEQAAQVTTPDQPNEAAEPQPQNTDPKLLECLREIQEARDEVRERELALKDLEVELGELKEAVKEAKDELHTAQLRLGDVIDRHRRLLASTEPQQNQSAGDGDGISGAVAFPAAGPLPQKPVDKDGWKVLPTSELAKHGLPVSTCSMLVKRGHETLGSLSVKGDRDGYRSIKGVSETKEEWIVNAFIEFWKAHPEYVDGEQGEHATEEAAAGQAAPQDSAGESTPTAASADSATAESDQAEATCPAPDVNDAQASESAEPPADSQAEAPGPADPVAAAESQSSSP